MVILATFCVHGLYVWGRLRYACTFMDAAEQRVRMRSDLKPGNVLLTTHATRGQDTRGFICKARHSLRSVSAVRWHRSPVKVCRSCITVICSSD